MGIQKILLIDQKKKWKKIMMKKKASSGMFVREIATVARKMALM